MENYNRTVWELFERMQGEIAREIRLMLREEPYDQRLFNEAERARRVEALIKCASDLTQTAEQRHEAWCQMHVDEGWIYGPEFKPAEKQHPNLMPWDGLPANVRSKANIFAICAKYASEVDACIRSGLSMRELDDFGLVADEFKDDGDFENGES